MMSLLIRYIHLTYCTMVSVMSLLIDTTNSALLKHDCGPRNYTEANVCEILEGTLFNSVCFESLVLQQGCSSKGKI